MKNKGFLLIITFALFTSCSFQSDKKGDNKDFSRYGIEKGIIHMVNTNSMVPIKNNITIYFKEHGAIEYSLFEMEMTGMKNKFELLKIDSLQYNIINGFATKARRKLNFSMQNFDLTKLDDKTILEYEIKKIGEEEVADMMCNKYSMDNKLLGISGFYWEWNLIPLKVVFTQNGRTDSTITEKIELDKEIDESLFTVLDNWTIIDATSIDNN